MTDFTRRIADGNLEPGVVALETGAPYARADVLGLKVKTLRRRTRIEARRPILKGRRARVRHGIDARQQLLQHTLRRRGRPGELVLQVQHAVRDIQYSSEQADARLLEHGKVEC